ncbi:MAG: hypothetical protein AB7U49_04080 [Hyphomicrobiaceae bacterium]
MYSLTTMETGVVRLEREGTKNWSRVAAFICFALAGILLLATLLAPHTARAISKGEFEILAPALTAH